MIVDSLLTVINYQARGQTAKTIIDYREEFQLAQNEW